jgi:hypothetical protein
MRGVFVVVLKPTRKHSEYRLGIPNASAIPLISGAYAGLLRMRKPRLRPKLRVSSAHWAVMRSFYFAGMLRKQQLSFTHHSVHTLVIHPFSEKGLNSRLVKSANSKPERIEESAGNRSTSVLLSRLQHNGCPRVS